jgi:sec-independent protein translocase protein TatC
MLIKYFFEIRNRAILIIFSWIATVIVAYLNKETLLFLSIKPNLSLFEKTSFYFIATNITDIFSAYLSLAYLVGFQLTFIFSLYHIKTFIIPALYEAEHKKLILFTYLSISLWGFSLLLLNTVVLPFCWNFFSSFQNSSIQSVNIFLEVRVTEYLSFYVLIYYITIFVGQGFVFIFLLIDALKKKLLFVRNTRKIFYVLFFVLATLITPPDVVSQLILGGSFVLVYELVIVIIIVKGFNLVTN